MTDVPRCEQFCDKPLQPGDDYGTDEILASCRECKERRRHLFKNVLPAIQDHGYYTPVGSTADEEFGDMQRQAGLQEQMEAILAPLKSKFGSSIVFPEEFREDGQYG